MKAWRMLAFLMIVVAALTLSSMRGARFFPVLAVTFAALGAWRRSEARLSRKQEVYAALGLAVLFVAIPRLGARGLDDVALLWRTGLSLAHLFILLMVICLFARSESGPPPRLVLYGAVAMILSGGVFVSDAAQFTYQALAIGYVGLSAYYCAACVSRPAEAEHGGRPGWFSRLTLFVCLALAAGTGLGLGLWRYGRQIDQFLLGPFVRPLAMGGAGFSDVSRLDSVLKRQLGPEDEKVALRVVSEKEPGYLRGRAYITYADSAWQTSSELAAVSPMEPARAGVAAPGQRLFALKGERDGEWEPMDMWPASAGWRELFLPMGALAVSVPAKTLSVDDQGGATCDEMPPGADYRVFAAAGPSQGREPLSAEMRRRLTATPKGLDPRVARLAGRIFEGRATAAEKMEAVQGYFERYHRYALGVTIPAGKDPLTYFLLERPDAHCEYFATGAAVLLRLGGVPARYVTGLVASEWNSVGRFWVARNKNAHAWVEAYDPERGWTLVEATPSHGLAEPSRPGVWMRSWDALRFRLQELRALLWRGGLKGVWGWVKARLGEVWGFLVSAPWVLLALGAASGALAGAWSLARSVWRRREERAQDPRLARMRRLLGRADRRARRRGFERRPNETLHQFARRLRQGAEGLGPAAAWYSRYAEARFSCRLTDAVVADLARTLPRA